MRRTAAALAAAVVAVGAAGCDSVRGRVIGGRTFTVPSCSMAPNINAGGKVVVKDAEPDELRRGNIVVYKLPGRDSGEFVARIVAVGGDHVEFKDSQFLLNGAPADEPYLKNHPNPITIGQRPPETIPAESYFVMGDNRGNSRDSRFFGPVPYADIVGKGTILKRGDGC